MKRVYDELFNEVFSEFFTDQRKMHKYSRKYVAERLGEKRSTYANWETGYRAIDIETLFRLCDIFEIDVNEFSKDFRKL